MAMPPVNKGKSLTEECKRKMSIALKGHPSPTKGKKMPRSEETRKRMIDKFGGINHPAAIPILWVEGNKVFPCLKYCCKELGLPNKSLNVLKCIKKYSHITIISIDKEEYSERIFSDWFVG